MKQTISGIILQSIGGFYVVEAADAVYTCRARGVFRKEGITPVAGDHVQIAVLEEGKGSIEEVLPRKNGLVRPPVANLDHLVLVASVAEPAPNRLVLDTMIALAERQEIEPVMVISKTDLLDGEDLYQTYRLAGLDCYRVSMADPATVEPLRKRLQGSVSVFTGNSGVGKSSLLNLLEPHLELETGEISRKLGRGRHTTRTATLFPLEGGGYWVDTPGFSSLDLERLDWISKEELPHCFREFTPYWGQCRFGTSCLHIREPGCAVREALEQGKIAPSRYESYVALYQEVKDKKEWERGG